MKTLVFQGEMSWRNLVLSFSWSFTDTRLIYFWLNGVQEMLNCLLTKRGCTINQLSGGPRLEVKLPLKPCTLNIYRRFSHCNRAGSNLTLKEKTPRILRCNPLLTPSLSQLLSLSLWSLLASVCHGFPALSLTCATPCEPPQLCFANCLLTCAYN